MNGRSCFIRFVANPGLITNHSLSPSLIIEFCPQMRHNNILSSFSIILFGFVDLDWLIWFGWLWFGLVNLVSLATVVALVWCNLVWFGMICLCGLI